MRNVLTERHCKGIEVCKLAEGEFIASVKFTDQSGRITLFTITSNRYRSEREAIEKLVKFLYSEACYTELDREMNGSLTVIWRLA